MASTTIEPYNYTFRITLLGVTPAVWRLVACPGSQTLETLHTVLQAAMGWTRAHPYEFEVNNKFYREPGGEGKESSDSRETRLEQLHLKQGTTITYVYDRGDDWVHQIIVEGVAPAVAANGLPLLLGGAGACPPEGSGGPGGYSELLQARKRRDTDEGKAAAAKLGNDHEPGVWDPEEAAKALAAFSPQPVLTPPAAAPVAAPAPAAQPQQGGGKNKKRRGR